MNKYSRPYCDKCKLIYSVKAVFSLQKCTKCGKFLRLKSFNPWLPTIAGIIILAIAISTLAVSSIPIMWIGGFIFGGSLIARGFSQWDKIKALDNSNNGNKSQEKTEAILPNHEVITCGSCGCKNQIPKGNGYTKLHCKKCGKEARVYT